MTAYRGWGIALAVLGVLAFSLRPILIKLAYAAHPISPVTLLFLRMVISFPFFAAVAWWLRDRGEPLSRRDWIGVAALGLLGYYLASFLDFMGLQYVGAGVGRLIMFMYPTLVLLLSFLFLKKAPSARQVMALVLSYAGIALVVSHQVSAEDRIPVDDHLHVRGEGLLPEREEDHRRDEQRPGGGGVHVAQLSPGDASLEDAADERDGLTEQDVRVHAGEGGEVARLGDDQLGHLRQLGVEGHAEGLDELPEQLLGRAVEGADEPLDALEVGGHGLSEHRLEELLLALEVEVDGSLAHAGDGRHVVEPGRGEAAVGEELQRGGDDLRRPRLLPPFPAPGRLRPLHDN